MARLRARLAAHGADGEARKLAIEILETLDYPIRQLLEAMPK